MTVKASELLAQNARPTDASCIFGFIYAQAEDYFWQVEDSFIRALGRAAEVYGEKALPDDLLMRVWGVSYVGQAELLHTNVYRLRRKLAASGWIRHLE